MPPIGQLSQWEELVEKATSLHNLQCPSMHNTSARTSTYLTEFAALDDEDRNIMEAEFAGEEEPDGSAAYGYDDEGVCYFKGTRILRESFEPECLR